MLPLFDIKIFSKIEKKSFVISTYFWALIDCVGGSEFRQTCVDMSWSKAGEQKTMTIMAVLQKLCRSRLKTVNDYIL